MQGIVKLVVSQDSVVTDITKTEVQKVEVRRIERPVKVVPHIGGKVRQVGVGIGAGKQSSVPASLEMWLSALCDE